MGESSRRLLAESVGGRLQHWLCSGFRWIIRQGFYPSNEERQRSNRKDHQKVQIRLAQSRDAARIVDLINAAFRRGEGHIIDGDRVDLEGVQSLLPKGEFLL